jgi:hypothetical protein
MMAFAFDQHENSSPPKARPLRGSVSNRSAETLDLRIALFLVVHRSATDAGVLRGFARARSSGFADNRRSSCEGPASPLFLDRVLRHRLVERQIGTQPLEASIFLSQLA